MKTITRTHVMRFLGYLTSSLPELHKVHPDRLATAWEEYAHKCEGIRETSEARLTEVERAAVGFVRAIGTPNEADQLANLRRQVDAEVGTTKQLPT